MTFFVKPQTEKTELDKAIDRIYEYLSNQEPNTDDYDKASDQLAKLVSLKSVNARQRLNPDTVLLVISNLAGIVAILGYERFNVLTSKALSLVVKPR